MASQQPPSRRRRLPPAMPREPIPTTIMDLGDDLILQIFLRLPSLPSLVRAALTCRVFLAALRSSPAFRRRFRQIHPPPVLGFFFDSNGSETPPFAPIRRRSDPDLAAAVRGADVFLTRLPYHEDAATGWELVMCHGGNLVLFNWNTRQVAAYNPLTRALDLVPLPEDEVYSTFFFLSSEEAPGSSRVLAICHGESEIRAAIFSPSTMDWRIVPLSEPEMAGPSRNKYSVLPGALLNGSAYWPHKSEACMLVLDTRTLQLSFIDLPVELKGLGETYAIGDTKEGNPCIVSATGFTLSVWFRRANADGVEEWVHESGISLEAEILQATKGSRDAHHALKVWDIIEGIVYMSTFETLRDHRLPSWFLSFCLETRKLEKLFHKTFDAEGFPYTMAWPPSLVRNNVALTLEGHSN